MCDLVCWFVYFLFFVCVCGFCGLIVVEVCDLWKDVFLYGWIDGGIGFFVGG